MIYVIREVSQLMHDTTEVWVDAVFGDITVVTLIV